VRIPICRQRHSLFCGWSIHSRLLYEHNVAMSLHSPYSCQPPTIEEIRRQRLYATKVKHFQTMNLPEKSGRMLTILQNKDQSAERLVVTKKRVSFNLEANVSMFYNNDPRSTKMGLAKWSSKRKDLCRWGDTPTDKGLPMPERNYNIHLKTDSRATTKTNKKCAFDLEANVPICYNNDRRSTKMGLAKRWSKQKNLCRWGDNATETKETPASVPRCPRKGPGKGLLDKMLSNSAEGLAQLPEAASRAATAAYVVVCIYLLVDFLRL
jgi:hypothetical protein